MKKYTIDRLIAELQTSHFIRVDYIENKGRNFKIPLNIKHTIETLEYLKEYLTK